MRGQSGQTEDDTDRGDRQRMRQRMREQTADETDRRDRKRMRQTEEEGTDRG